jgi:hypothetical protein
MTIYLVFAAAGFCAGGILTFVSGFRKLQSHSKEKGVTRGQIAGFAIMAVSTIIFILLIV